MTIKVNVADISVETIQECIVDQIAVDNLSLGEASLSREITDENRALFEHVGIIASVHKTESQAFSASIAKAEW